MSSARTAEPGAAPARTLVVGLGNPERGDDGVGWRVIDALRDELRHRHPGERELGAFELDQLAVGGLTLMERLVGYEHAILVDAISSGASAPGTVTSQPLAAVETRVAGHLDSSHDAGLTAALDAGRALGALLPTEITAVLIEAAVVDTFGEQLSAAVEAAVPRAVATVIRLLSDAA